MSSFFALLAEMNPCENGLTVLEGMMKRRSALIFKWQQNIGHKFCERLSSRKCKVKKICGKSVNVSVKENVLHGFCLLLMGVE